MMYDNSETRKAFGVRREYRIIEHPKQGDRRQAIRRGWTSKETAEIKNGILIEVRRINF